MVATEAAIPGPVMEKDESAGTSAQSISGLVSFWQTQQPISLKCFSASLGQVRFPPQLL